MIIIKNKNLNKEIKINEQTPFFIYYSFLLLLLSIFLAIVGSGISLSILSSLLLIIGAIQSKKEGNFQEFYQLPLILLITQIVLEIVLVFLFGNNEELLEVAILIAILLYFGRLGSMVYNLITGRAREIKKHLKAGYEVSNFNDLNKKGLKIVNQAKKNL
ncbi:MAG: hypothetical protein ACK5HR_05630 [Mycoplasmatales bacterium]